jgi:hypothetical protein
MLPVFNSEVPGTMAICPEINKNPPAFTAWLYGPIGAGAFEVFTISLLIFILFLKGTKVAKLSFN